MPPKKGPAGAAASVRISGRVQGVGYRYFAERTASALGLTGWVRNLPNGEVEAEVEGSKPAIESWIKQLREGPPLAQVDRLDTSWFLASNKFNTFTIKF